MGKLKVRVGDQWEEVAPAPVEEVVVSTEDPYVTDPTTTTELWYDPDAVRPPSMEEEVYVGPDDPDVVAPLNTVDLWYDPDDDTTSAAGDEVWVGPDDPDPIVPGIELWYDTAAVAATSPGVGSGGLTNQVLTKKSDADGDTHWTGPYSSAVMRRHAACPLVAGSPYFLCILNSGGANILRASFAVRSGTNVQTFEFWAHSNINASPDVYKLQLIDLPMSNGTKMFDRITLNFHGGGVRLMLRAAFTGNVDIGWHMVDLLNAGSYGPTTITLDTTGAAESTGVAL